MKLDYRRWFARWVRSKAVSSKQYNCAAIQIDPIRQVNYPGWFNIPLCPVVRI